MLKDTSEVNFHETAEDLGGHPIAQLSLFSVTAGVTNGLGHTELSTEFFRHTQSVHKCGEAR